MDIRIAEQFADHLPLLAGKSVLEIGSLDVNGSIRPFAELFAKSYVGIDLAAGKNVDQICSIENIIDRFGTEAFDAVICLETLEHVLNWKKAISNIKKIVKKEGSVFISAPTVGFEYHAYPNDFWRYTPSDFSKIFCDFEVLHSKVAYRITTFVAKKPVDWQFVPLENIELTRIQIPTVSYRNIIYQKMRRRLKTVIKIK